MDKPDYNNFRNYNGEPIDINGRFGRLSVLSDFLTALNIGYIDHFYEKDNQHSGSIQCVALWEPNKPRVCRGYLDKDIRSTDVPIEKVYNDETNSVSLDEIGPAVDNALINLDISSMNYSQLRAVNFAIPLIDDTLNNCLSDNALNKWNQLKEIVRETPQLTEETFKQEIEKIRPILDEFRKDHWEVEAPNELHSEYCVIFPDSFEMAGYDYAFSAMDAVESLWDDVYEQYMFKGPMELNLKQEYTPKNLHEVEKLYENFAYKNPYYGDVANVCRAIIDVVQEPDCGIANDINKDNYKDFCYPDGPSEDAQNNDKLMYDKEPESKGIRRRVTVLNKGVAEKHKIEGKTNLDHAVKKANIDPEH